MTDKEKAIAFLKDISLPFEERYGGSSLYCEGVVPGDRIIGFVEFSFDEDGRLTYLHGAGD